MAKGLIPAPKFTSEDRDRARKLYLDSGDFSKVAAETGISVDTLRKWAARGHAGVTWQTDREELARSILEDGFSRRKLSVAAAANISPDLIHRGLQALAARETPLSPAEMERVANVHSVLDRIARLDAGKSTENMAVAAKVKLTIEQIKEILAADPLIEPGE